MSIQSWTYVLVGITFSIYIAIAIWSRVQSTKEFYVAGGGVGAWANGMATAADWMSAASFISMAGDGEYQSFIVGVLNLTKTALPEELMLFPAYPNPLNPVTTIKFGLPQASYVNLDIYDINGRIVNNLINHYLHSGYHEINWNAGNHSSGLYFTRLQSGKKVIIQKLIVLK